MIPSLLEHKKINGKNLLMEVFIKKKNELFSLYIHLLLFLLTPDAVSFYKEKQKWRDRAEEKFVEAITISPAEGETAIDIIQIDFLQYISTFQNCNV